MSFDYVTAADLVCDRPVSKDKLKSFAEHARWTYDDNQGLLRINNDLKREISLRDNEIAILKEALLDKD